MKEDLDQYIQSSEFIDSDNKLIVQFAKEIVGTETDPTLVIKKLFEEIRDKYSYHPFQMDMRRESLKASWQVNQKTGYCVSKALLLSACARTMKIPARVCFFVVKNHLGTGKLEEALKTDLIVFHGSSEAYLNNKWIKLVPAFDKSLCEKLGVSVTEFDGINDAIFQEYRPENGNQADEKQYMEYVKEYGSFHDFPYELARSELMAYYPDAFDKSVPVEKRVLFKYW